MARTQDYFDFLVENIDIAPTNSQEEVDAAQLIANVFDAHGLEPTVQEFEAPENSSLFQGIAMVLLFLGLFLSGIGGAGLTAFGILLAAAGAALLIMRYLGNDVVGAYGPVAKSQNVIGFHEATGSLAAKGNRPIVIVAHYDTPREDLFWIPALAPYMGILKQACVVCVPLVAGVALFQALGFLPGIFRRVLWLIGLIASLPVLLWGVTIIARRFMGCTPGANNNKAGVAALLGILDKVRPADDGVAVTTRPRRTRESIASRLAGAVSEVVRHGKEVLESLSILPDSTEIEYTEPEASVAGAADSAQLLETGVIESDDFDADATNAMEMPGGFPVVSDDAASDLDVSAAETGELAATGTLSEPEKKPETATPDRMPRRFSNRGALFDLPDPSMDAVDPLDTTAEREAIRSGKQEETPTPTPQTAPVVQPARVDTADAAPVQRDEIGFITADDLEPAQNRRRRGLFGRRRRNEESMSEWLGVDSDFDAKSDGRRIGSWDRFNEDEGDGNWKGGATENGRFRVFYNNGPAPESESEPQGEPQDDDFELEYVDGSTFDDIPNPYDEEPEAADEAPADLKRATEELEAGSRPFSMPRNPFASVLDSQIRENEERANEESEALGAEAYEPATGDNAYGENDYGYDDGGHGYEDVAPDDAELLDAVLSMDDELLISHDIWFVAVGSSDLDHAGIKAFLSEYRRSCRGAFLINLDCIGSGELSVLTEEGLEGRRRADRRLVRLLSDTAADIHIDLAHSSMPWGDTDATPAMRTSMRSVTITGLDEHGLPSRAHSLDDEPEYVDDQQVEDVCNLVTELIRRS